MTHLDSLPSIRYEQPDPGRFKWQADAVAGSIIFEYKGRIRDLRMLQGAVMSLAQVLQENPDRKAVLIIDETRISPPRMEAEWQSYEGLFHPSVFLRLSMAVFEGGEWTRTYGDLSDEERALTDAVRSKLGSEQPFQKRRSPDSFLDLFRVVLIHWFRRSGPLQMKELGRLTGFSYPTVAAGLEKMDRHLRRHSDRSVELRDFPLEIWRKLLVDSQTLRSPIALVAQKPRPLDLLLENLEGYAKLEFGLGGIIGARHYLPGIDLVGTHRLDLTLKNTSEERIRQLTRRLDPALKPADAEQVPQVVIHLVFRPHTFFAEADDGRPVADEVECLLDLHEARLESQANELLEHLIRRARV